MPVPHRHVGRPSVTDLLNDGGHLDSYSWHFRRAIAIWFSISSSQSSCHLTTSFLCKSFLVVLVCICRVTDCYSLQHCLAEIKFRQIHFNMKLSILAAFLSSCSLSIACMGTAPCHDGPYNPAMDMQRTNTKGPNKNSNPYGGLGQYGGLGFGGFPSGAGGAGGAGGKQSGGGKSNTMPILPRGLDSYEYSVHNARGAVLKAREAIAEAHDAVLQARSFYDYEDTLYAREAEFDDGTLYGRDAYGYDFYEEYVPRSLSSGSGGVSGPQLPSDVDPNGLHLFHRLNTVPKAYPPFGSVNHAGLNKLMADLGGQVKSMVYPVPLDIVTSWAACRRGIR